MAIDGFNINELIGRILFVRRLSHREILPVSQQARRPRRTQRLPRLIIPRIHIPPNPRVRNSLTPQLRITIRIDSNRIRSIMRQILNHNLIIPITAITRRIMKPNHRPRIRSRRIKHDDRTRWTAVATTIDTKTAGIKPRILNHRHEPMRERQPNRAFRKRDRLETNLLIRIPDPNRTPNDLLQQSAKPTLHLPPRQL